MTQRGKCQRAVRGSAEGDPPWGNCGLPDEHDGDCVWEALMVKVQPALEDFETTAGNGAYTYLECPDGDCHELPVGRASWTIQAQIEAAIDHNRRYHS